MPRVLPFRVRTPLVRSASAVFSLVVVVVVVETGFITTTGAAERYMAHPPDFFVLFSSSPLYLFCFVFRALFARLQMGTAEDGHKAIKALNGIEIQG